jgi:hypothetical protein
MYKGFIRQNRRKSWGPGTPFPSTARLASRWLGGRLPSQHHGTRDVDLETGYCAEIVALTYEAMSLLPEGRRPNWYDAGLPRAQPMGFYSPQSLVADARRHGVHVREPDINASDRAARSRRSRKT